MLKWVPNLLTISRILIIPIVIIAFYIKDEKFSCRFITCLFLLASITDFLDGYIARVWNAQSALGRFLDPIADKLLIASIIMMLIKFNKINIFPAIAIVCREILVSGLREFLAEIRISVPVNKLAKIKTVMQMIAIFLLVLGNEGSGLNFVDSLGKIFIWVAALLTIITGYVYLEASIKHITKQNG